MAPSLFLLAAVVLAFTGGTAGWVMIATVVLATAAGTRLPDLDTPLGLGHRSALLHGMLPLAVALLDRRTWPVAAGLGFGIGLHLSADLFPNGMRGFATVKVPGWGAMGAGASYLWLLANAAGSIAAAAVVLGRVADGRAAGGALAGVGVLGIAYLATADGGWCALLLFAALGWLALR